MKFLNTGEVQVGSSVKITYDAPAHHFTGGDVLMDGNLKVVKDITDSNGLYGTVQKIRMTYNGHTHPENGDGGGITSKPNQQLT